MKLTRGGLRPGEAPAWVPNRETVIFSSFNLHLARDGKITIYVPKRPEFGDPRTSKQFDFELSPGETLSRVLSYKTGEEYVITIERKPSNVSTMGQARRVKEKVSK
jgi:hypothetical protein